VVGAHCTAVEAVYRIRALAGLTSEMCMVGTVDASYSLTRGISAGRVTK
jgi:7,8-dihydropterin-6-yl-methyl-4-(beta-D-ribofuranosyl)aminobenzene 5'-phosphate synthase